MYIPVFDLFDFQILILFTPLFRPEQISKDVTFTIITNEYLNVQRL